MKSSKTNAGIGHKRDCEGRLGDFVSFTGGSRDQRLHERQYSKDAHQAHAKALVLAERNLEDPEDVSAPKVFNIFGGGRES